MTSSSSTASVIATKRVFHPIERQDCFFKLVDHETMESRDAGSFRDFVANSPGG